MSEIGRTGIGCITRTKNDITATYACAVIEDGKAVIRDVTVDFPANTRDSTIISTVCIHGVTPDMVTINRVSTTYGMEATDFELLCEWLYGDEGRKLIHSLKARKKEGEK